MIILFYGSKTVSFVNILCYILTTLLIHYKKCGAPNFEKLYKINNWLHCGEGWAQLSLKFSPYPTKKNPIILKLPLNPQLA